VINPPYVFGDGIHDDTEAIWWYVEHGMELPDGECGVYRIVQTEYWGTTPVPTERVTSAPLMFLVTGEPD
jgi:hypothetical protein